MKIDFSNMTSLRVRYGETDQMGYCYYGNYAQYFEVGRVEAMRSVGMSYRDLEDSGIMLPVSDFSVKYIRPALYDDLLTIKTKISSLNGAKLAFDYEIYNEDNVLLSVASTTLIFVDKLSMRPTKPPQAFINLVQKYACTDELLDN
jgi:acyl-CoA thioester hydrolase